MSQCRGVVVEASDTHLVVELPARETGCGKCNQPGGCRSGLLGIEGEPRRLSLPNLHGARLGDEISLVVADGAVWQAARFAYVAPLLLVLGGATVGQYLVGSDAAAAIGMVVGLMGGVIVLRRGEFRARQQGAAFALHQGSNEVNFSKEMS